LDFQRRKLFLATNPQLFSTELSFVFRVQLRKLPNADCRSHGFDAAAGGALVPADGGGATGALVACGGGTTGALV
jgi:hypothetical protein